jgi:magnesium-protoporphyrin IX monomethyl ester (oxidative) cyclase
LPKNYLKEVLPYLEPPSHISIFYEVKADLSEEDVQVLANARVTQIQPGIESLATSTLKLMKKGTNAFQNIALLKNCAQYGISPGWNLLIGFPGEEESVYEKYIQDLPLLAHLPPPEDAFPVRFDRYSPYFVQAKKYDLDLHPLDYYSLTYPFDQESLANFAYYFTDRNLNATYSTTMIRWIGKIREKVGGWLKRWHGKDGAMMPALFIKERGKVTVIYDSRTGEVKEHYLDEIAANVLEYFSKARRITDLAADLNHIPQLDPSREVAYLQERGLLFQEGERYLSLVLPRRPKAMSDK